MLVKYTKGQESLRHYCNNKNRHYLNSKPAILLHDVQASIMLDNDLINIKYCPYCGIEIENDTRGDIKC